MARRHQSGPGARFRREPEPPCGGRAGEIVGLHLRHVGAELLEGFPNVAREARLDRGFQVGIALAHDLLHGRRLHAGLLQLRERLACIHRVELFCIAHQHDPGKAQGVCDPQEVAGLDRGGEGSLVHHQHGLPISGSHLPLALLRQPSLGHPGVAGKEALQGLALDPGLRFQGPRGRGRGREALDLVAPLLEERAGAAQHGGLAGPGIALHADNAVLFREDQLDRVPLALRQRSLSEGLVHGPGAHRDRFPSLAGLHQGDRFPLVGHGPARGEHVLCPWRAGRVQRSGLLQPAHFPFRLRHGHRAGVPGERAGEKIGAGEHRLALGEMRHGPFHAFPGQPPVPRRLASRTGAFPAGVPRYGALRHRFGRKGLRVEPEMGGLFLPDPPQRRLIDIALAGPGHERRALGEALVLCRCVHAPLGHGRLDLRPSCRERLDHLAGNARDLEPPVSMGLLDPVAEPAQIARQFAPVHGADQHLRGIELLVGHGPPLAVRALHHVGDHRMGMKQGIEIARGVVPKGRRDHLLPSLRHHFSRLRVLHAGLGHIPLDPVEGALHGPVMGLDDALVAADERGEGDGLGGGEGEIPPGPVLQGPIGPPASELLSGAVGRLALQHRPEEVRIDRAGEAVILRALAGPGARFPVGRVVLRVVAVPLVVARALGRGGDGADRGDHVRGASNGPEAALVVAPRTRACCSRSCPEAKGPGRLRWRSHDHRPHPFRPFRISCEAASRILHGVSLRPAWAPLSRPVPASPGRNPGVS